MYSYKHPRPAQTVDIVLFRTSGAQDQVLLIKRRQDPFQDCYALPGGFMEIDETLEDAARRELKEETGLTGIPLQQVHTFSDLNRDPRGRVLSTAYAGKLESNMMEEIRAGSDALEASWFNLNDLPQLAFDHLQILRKAADLFGLVIDDA